MTKFTKDMIVSDILDKCPETYAVLIKYFGSECFLSPELKMESIDTNAEIYEVDVNKIISEMNLLIQ